MDTPTPVDSLDASFDIVARQDASDAAIEGLRGDVEEVKSRLDKVSRAASRPVLDGAAPAPSIEVKSFVDGYLRLGRENEVKSLSGAVLADGGYAVPREIDERISAQLRKMSPIRAIAQVVQVGSAGYALRTGQWPDLDEIAARRGFAVARDMVLPGDVLLLKPSASQMHFAIAGSRERTWVEAHAGLRRVVIAPMSDQFPLIRRWRLV